MVAEEDPPLARVGDGRGGGEDVDDGGGVPGGDRHVEAGHHGEVERHVALVAVAEVLNDVVGPLVGLGEEDGVGELGGDRLPDLLQVRVGLGQVLSVGAVPFVQVRDRIEPEPVEPGSQPVRHHVLHRLAHAGMVEVEVRLVPEEPVPVVLPGDVVPGPVGVVGVDEDHPGLGPPTGVVGPHVPVPLLRPGPAGLLEPRMLIRGVIDDGVGDHPHPPVVGGGDQPGDVLDGAVAGQHLLEVGDVVAAVLERGLVEREQPQAVDPQPLQVVELLAHPLEVADPVAVRVEEGVHRHLVEDGVPEPRGRHAGECIWRPTAFVRAQTFLVLDPGICHTYGA